MTKFMKTLMASTLFVCAIGTGSANAAVELAVVHVFADPLQAIIDKFVDDYPEYADVKFNLDPGSAGGLYNDIYTALAGAGPSPYNMFFSVDSTYPSQLHTSFPTTVGTPFEYAQGSLVLTSNNVVNVTSGLPSAFGSTGICNPSSGPYGDAAIGVLQNIYSIPSTDTRITQYNGIGLVLSNTISKTVNTGFLAKAQVCNGTGSIVLDTSKGWDSAATYHEYTPGTGYAASVLLHTGTVIARPSASSHENDAIAALAAYMNSAAAQTIIQDDCYSLPTSKATAAQSYASIKQAADRMVRMSKPVKPDLTPAKPKH